MPLDAGRPGPCSQPRGEARTRFKELVRIMVEAELERVK